MPRYILFIRRPGCDDHAEQHPTEESALTALVDQARKDWPQNREWTNDDDAIAWWAAQMQVTHAIVRVAVTQH